MDISEAKLVHKIPKKNWEALRDKYKMLWPRHIVCSYTLKNFIEWTKENPKLDVAIYTGAGDWQKHASFALVEYCGARCNVFFNTLHPEKDGDILFGTLDSLPINGKFTFAAFVDGVRPIAEKYVSKNELTRDDECYTLLYYLDLKEASELRIDDSADYEFRKLSLENFEHINDLWEHKYPGSDIFIKNLILYNESLGAYEKTTGNLRGWVFQEQVGTIGLLHVEKSFRRRGIGENLVRRMAKILACAGMDSAATVLATNRPSRKCFHKMGFRIIDKMYWHDISPPKPVFRDSVVKLRPKKVNTCSSDWAEC